jgi:uncharacterized protein (TIGR02145 family)
LSASSNGAVIDWYADAAGTSTLHTSASYTTPKIETSTTYYVQARVESTGCVSAERVAVLAEVITEGCCHAPGATATFAEFNPCAGASYGATYTLTDDRDQKTYKVKYMPDGRYWMVQNLAFGNCTVNSYKDDNSAVAAADFPNVSEGYVGHCRPFPKPNVGFAYTWAAAMNNVNAFRGSTISFNECTASHARTTMCRGICPDGWHIPIYTEMSVVISALETQNLCPGNFCWRPDSAFEGQYEDGCSSTCGDRNGIGYVYISDRPNTWATRWGYAISYSGGGNIATAHESWWASAVRCTKND